MSAPNIIYTSDDGVWGVIVAKDVPPGVARSKTRDDAQDALNAPWDPALTTPVGPGSVNKYVKVKLSDLKIPLPARINLNPAEYKNKKVGKIIPDYPHTCAVCGGKMLILFSSQEHEGGKPCPGPQKKISLRRK